MRPHALALFLLTCTAAHAQSLPDRYAVTGVAASDVLNIRNGPGASFDKVGTLDPFTRSVEVIEADNSWAMIPMGEGYGWVSVRYLTPNPTPAHEIPRPLICSGTEPFWDIAFYQRGAEYNELALEGRRDLTVVREIVAPNGYYIETQEDPTLNRILTVIARTCSDGMSERIFSMSATLFTEAPDGNYTQAGCCTIQEN